MGVYIPPDFKMQCFIPPRRFMGKKKSYNKIINAHISCEVVKLYISDIFGYYNTDYESTQHSITCTHGLISARFWIKTNFVWNKNMRFVIFRLSENAPQNARSIAFQRLWKSKIFPSPWEASAFGAVSF